METCAARFDRVLTVLSDVGDVVAGRVVADEVPEWCRRRGWDAFLLSLDDDALRRCEGLGLAHAIEDHPEAPESLRALCGRVLDATRVPTVEETLEAAPTRRVKHRKRGQVASLVSLLSPHARSARRVVDVGAGHGHLARTFVDALGVSAVGLERDPDRVRTARELAEDHDGLEFVEADLDRRAIDLGAGDLAVGLHACGALGDALVDALAEAPARGLLVSCCLQKIDGDDRQPLSRRGRQAGMTLAREVLGLTNLANRYDGVEHPIDDIMFMRLTRHALRLLLLDRGVSLRVGEEAYGINRRRMRHGLRTLAPEVLSRRGLSPAGDHELERIERRARAEHARIRRLSLPRSMLGRLLELAVVLDRACALEERGRPTEVFEAFDASSSPRNLALLSHPAR